VKKKKSFWHRRDAEEKTPREGSEVQVNTKKSTALLQIPESWQGLDDRVKDDPLPAPGITIGPAKHASKQSDVSNASEFPMRSTGSAATKSDGGPRKGLFGFFSKKKEDKAKGPMQIDCTFVIILPNAFANNRLS
jgi:hypothetical protein